VRQPMRTLVKLLLECSRTRSLIEDHINTLKDGASKGDELSGADRVIHGVSILDAAQILKSWHSKDGKTHLTVGVTILRAPPATRAPSHQSPLPPIATADCPIQGY